MEGIIEVDGGGVVGRPISLEMSCVPIFNGWEGLVLRFKVGDAASRIFLDFRFACFPSPFFRNGELVSSPSDITLKSRSSIPGCKRPPSFGDSPQNCTGPNKEALKMSSSSPGTEADEIISKSSSNLEIVIEASILNRLPE